MDKITDYQLVTAEHVSDLARMVKASIEKEKWEPLGPPFPVTTAGGSLLVQAMVIYKRGGPG